MKNSNEPNDVSQQIEPSQIYSNRIFGSEVNAVFLEGEFWYFAEDVCSALELGNLSQALTRLDEDERSTIISNDGGPNRNIINVSGVFTLMLSSWNPPARAFKKWVTADVLPSISRPSVCGFQLRQPTLSELHLALEQLNSERDGQIESLIQGQQAISAKLEAITSWLTPSAYSQRDMHYERGDLSMEETAQLLGTGLDGLYIFLGEQRIFGRGEKTWNLSNPAFEEKGYFVNPGTKQKNGEINTSAEVLVTPRGRDWLFQLACEGLLDQILLREALLSRITNRVSG